MSEPLPALTLEQVQAAFAAMDDAKDLIYLTPRPLTLKEVSIVNALQQSMDDIESALWCLDGKIVSGELKTPSE